MNHELVDASNWIKQNHLILNNEKTEMVLFGTNQKLATDSFITDLHALTEHSEYGTLGEEMIRDRIVVGMLNAKLAEKLQLQAD